MKTVIEVSFDLVGVSQIDRFVRDDEEIATQRLALVNDLQTAAAMPPVQWEQGFPDMPQDRLEYSRAIQQDHAPATVVSITKDITPVLNELRSQVQDTRKRIAAPDAALLTERLADADGTTYELRPIAGSACIPFEPPPNGHIAGLTVYYSVGGQMQRLPWPIESGGRIYTYTIDCVVKFLLEED